MPSCLLVSLLPLNVAVKNEKLTFSLLDQRPFITCMLIDLRGCDDLIENVVQFQQKEDLLSSLTVPN